MRLIRTGFLGALMVLLACAASAMAGTFSGSLNYTPPPPPDVNDSVLTFGAPTGNTWSEYNFTIGWTVTNVNTPLVNNQASWQYTYTLTTASTKNFSEVLIGASPYGQLSEYFITSGGVAEWVPPSSVGVGILPSFDPDKTWFLKFDTKDFGENHNTVEISFYTLNSPVWGSFFASDGQTKWPEQGQPNPLSPYDNYAYNSMFGQSMEGLPAVEGVVVAGYIIRPDGFGNPPPPVPEPLTMASAFLAIGGLGAYIRRRSKSSAR